MKILVLVGVYKGIIKEVKVFRMDKKGAEMALKAKEKLMGEYEYDPDFTEFPSENHVELFDREI